jgi:hypothetical protein
MTAWRRLLVRTLVILPPIVISHDGGASPPACDRSEAALFAAADAVVEAAMASSRRWNSSPTTMHLVAKYRIQEVFKGALKAGDVVIATDTCLDIEIPEEVLGYPGVRDYCLGDMNLWLTGVRTVDGKALPRRDGGWVLFLVKDYRPGAPQQTWLEVDPTSFSGDCDMTPAELEPEQQPAFARMSRRRGAQEAQQ